jgi:quercetin dioxygenase-like cupin family protein
MSVLTSANADRRFYSAVQKDAATFIETVAESGGERTLLEVELEPGGGNALHRHRSYAEHFEVLEGELSVHLDGAVHRLGPGETATAPIGSLHCFSNASAERAVFRVELRPGHRGFERALQVGYGLATDGRTTRSGMPRNPLVLALLLEWSDIEPSGAARGIVPVASKLAEMARRRGLDRELTARYCRV